MNILLEVKKAGEYTRDWDPWTFTGLLLVNSSVELERLSLDWILRGIDTQTHSVGSVKPDKPTSKSP